MKSINSFFILLISVFFFIYGCSEIENKKDTLKEQRFEELTLKSLPSQSYLNIDSLPISIPGMDGLKKAKTFSSNLPKPIESIGITKIFPGVSFLYQTTEEKLTGKLSVISKYPEIHKVNYSKLKSSALSEKNNPNRTILSKEINIEKDSISYYEEIVRERGMVSIQHQDSIFPPLSFLAGRPIRTKSLPFRYKDEVINDISILDFDQGLPSRFIRAIAKDDEGVLWFATFKGGLVAYDGNYFDEYLMNMGPTTELTMALLIDKKGLIWTGTTNGANCFDGKKHIRYTMRQGLPSNNVFAIIEDGENNIWFATDEGVSIFNGKTISTYTTAHGLPMNYVYSLFEDDSDNIWFGTFGEGVTKFDGTTFTTFTKNDGLASDVVLSITQDRDGNMWFGTMGGGASKFDGTFFTNYSTEQGLVSDVILSIIEDADNNMWFGSYGYGLSIFNGKSFINYSAKEGLSDDYLRVMFEGSNGNVLIGTDRGLTKFNNEGFLHLTKNQGLINNNITAIYQDNKGVMWFANYDNGVLIYNKPKKSGEIGTFTQITTEQGLANNIVNAIMQDNQNNYWFSTYGGGVSKLDGKSYEKGILNFTNYSLSQGMLSSVVKQVLQDNNGNMWFATDQGATLFDGNQFKSIVNTNGLGADKVLCVFIDRSEAIWFGTMGGGVTRYSNDTLFRYTTDQGLGNNTVWTIVEDCNGVLWFGTDGGGLSYFNGHSFSTLNEDDGLYNNYIFSITTTPDNSLWAGTFKGLSQIKLTDTIHSIKNIVEYIKPTVINYSKMDGLKGLDFYTQSVFYDNMNRLWWGTEKALTTLDLNTFKPSGEVPIIHMNSISINSQPLDFNEINSNNNNTYPDIHFSGVSDFHNIPTNLSLPSSKNHITFNYSAIDWSGPNQIKYQYKLQGFDEKWSLLTKDNIVDYRNIFPGDYVFMVRAIGKSGKWSNEFEFPFIIRWPWWLSWWSILFYVITIIIAVLLLIRWRVNIIKRQKVELENMVARRTRDLDKALILAEQATNAKGQFLTTITHEIRTPLNAIMGLTHLALQNTPSIKQEDYLQKIDRSANTMLSLINNILDFSKIEVGKMQLERIPFDIEIVMSSVIIMNAHHAHEKGLEFVINIDSNIPKTLIGDPLRIGQVLTNLCSNAIKFTTSGEVVINIDLDKELNEKEINLKVSVKDTGIGIEKEKIPFLFEEFEQADNSITRKYGGTGLGLSISKLLIDLMGGHIWLNSEPGIGTTFFFDCTVGIQEKEEVQKKLDFDELKRINILVCDNNASAIKAMKTILHALTLNVDTVSSGEHVINQLMENEYDLLIINHFLDRINGIDIITKANSIPDLHQLKTILITNSDNDIKKYKKEADLINGYLFKPILPSLVFEEILTVFGLEKTTHQQRDNKKMRLEQIRKVVSESNILIVEDNELNMQVLIELLDQVGAKVDLAVNGAIAVDKVLENKYDLIFMDLHMPIMDGYNATVEIRKCNSDLPIIATTADTSEDIKLKCKKVGIDDIITKPIDPDLLYDVLLKWVNSKERNKNRITQPSDVKDVVLPKISINDLDIQFSIRRFGDNEELYLKMLKKFIASNRQTCLELNELIQQGDFETAHLKIHTLKGESGNIGANKVQENSIKVEQTVLKKDVKGFEKELVPLKKSLEDLTSELQCYFNETIYKINKDQPSFREQVKELIKYLKIRDPKVFDLLDKLNESDIEKSELSAINKAVNSEKFEEACALLKKLIAYPKK